MFRKILAATAALTLGFGGVIAFAGAASASDENCRTESTGWVTEAPDDDSWDLVATKTVTDEEAVDPTDGYYMDDLQWNVWTGGPILGEDVPAVDSPDWNPTQGDPQSENHSIPPREVNVPYYVSHGGSGNGDWFLWTQTWVPGTDGSDAVTHKEYKFERENCEPVIVNPPVPQATADGECGLLTATARNAVEEKGVDQEDATFVIRKGDRVTDRVILSAGQGYKVKYPVNLGRNHVITVSYLGDVLAEGNSGKNCKPDEPKPPKTDKPPKSGPPAPELPHTGGNLLLALLGLGLVGGGLGLHRLGSVRA